MTHSIDATVAAIRHHCGDKQPRVGIVLGSGLGGFAEQLTDVRSLAYADIPGFPVPSVAGHAGQFHLGVCQGIPVACLQGRAHYYEGYDHQTIKTLIRTLWRLGCESLILTNAVGALDARIGVGELGLITDHLNFQGRNPLIGPNDAEFGERFVSQDEVYDATLRMQLSQAAEQKNIALHPGIYAATLGPVFETPAEIRAFRLLGADFVGMSTVAEAVVANHCGLPVAAISCVTNLAAGLSTEKLSHAGTLKAAEGGAENLQQLLTQWLGNLAA